MNKKNTIILISIAITLIIIVGAICLRMTLTKQKPEPEPAPIVQTQNFDETIIKKTHETMNSNNYMISPMSIAYALTMTKEGASSTTRDELQRLVGNYDIKNINIQNRIGIANALFISDRYTQFLNEDYKNTLLNKYNSEILVDSFQTPDVINNWVKEKTYNMIPKAMEQISPDFVLGITNAIAIDVEWEEDFPCEHTRPQEFTTESGHKFDVEMMYAESGFSYISDDSVRGIVKDYKMYDRTTGEELTSPNNNSIQLEYIALLPENIDEYIKNFKMEDLKQMLANKKENDEKTQFIATLPRYTYDFTYTNLDSNLKNLGLNQMYDPNNADLSKIISKEYAQLYVDKVIHKTKIELNETGTKAAAVTIVAVDKNTALPPEKLNIHIDFNRPFVYLIKEKNSDTIWFFGTVYEPLKWTNESFGCLYKEN